MVASHELRDTWMSQAQQETPGSWKGGGGGGGGGVKREGSFTSNTWLKSQLMHVKQLAEETMIAARQRHASPHARTHTRTHEHAM
jgi:hypothetical protein